ncbi:CxC2 domain-containing protein [Mycena venus]|uniref:CxC2 domain-containing protein n=1 Tax=Mycena venus TaxID=2733690 RepID=A0A8H6XYA7_9AGAR|nr:CxC2 domain-containing protein [Mycena venus]
MGALRLLTDNAFTANVPDPYANFLRLIRVWDYLTLLKRSGQMHGIDLLLPHRPEGNLVLYCPACPEPGFNTDPSWSETPESLRHLNQRQQTLDGNFQCNQYSKNSDPDDVSLCKGRGQFPLDSEYKEYLASIPVSTEKSTCNYLKVVNKQDKKKFKNMAITGTVNVQCSHVFILSCADLQLGERFANSDQASATSIRQHTGRGPMTFKFRMEVDDVDEMRTYDIACEYTAHLEERFAKELPGWNQDSCMYLFGTSYISCIGHFHGDSETAEKYWPEADQLGPHVRQMNNGHRQDTMIDHHNDWNYKKLVNLGETLAAELALGKRKFLEKLNYFRGLSAAAGDLVDKWKVADRTARKMGKDVSSVYKHNISKVPSQVAIYQHMLAQDEQFEGSMVPRNKVARFLNEALMIQEDQRKLIRALDEAREQGLQSLGSEIVKRQEKLDARLVPWRREQREIMPKIGDRVASQSATSPPCPVENEKLFIPSDLTAAERRELGLTSLGVEEARWREGQAFDALRGVRTVVKAIRALRDRKEKNERQQKQNSRAGDHISDAVRRRDFRMATYGAARQAMISLDSLSEGPDSAFPPLSVLGDSRFTDGRLFTVGSGAAQSSIQPTGVSPAAPSTDAGPSTQMSKRKSADVALEAQLDESISHPKALKKRPKKAEERKEGKWMNGRKSPIVFSGSAPKQRSNVGKNTWKCASQSF